MVQKEEINLKSEVKRSELKETIDREERERRPLTNTREEKIKWQCNVFECYKCNVFVASNSIVCHQVCVVM